MSLNLMFHLTNTQNSGETLEKLKNKLAEKEKILNEAKTEKYNAEKSYNDAIREYDIAQKNVEALEGVAYSDRE